MPGTAALDLSYDAVIVNYYSTDLLLELLADFNNLATLPAQIIVIDNGSNDDPERVKRYFPQVSLVKNHSNLGFAKAANQGWKLGKSPLVLFINPDARLLQDDYSALINYVNADPHIGAAGPCVLDHDGSVQGSARGFHNFWTLLAGRKGPLSKLFPDSKVVRRDLPILASDGNAPMKVDWISGACVFVKRQALKKVGGFDEGYFMYFEDTDLCRALETHGWGTYYYPHSLISHRVGQSSQKRPLQTLWWFHKSWHRYMCKHHFPTNPLLQMLAAHVVGISFITRAALRFSNNLLRKR